MPYRNPALPVKTRVDDLLRRMTLAEKVGQLLQLDGQKVALELIRTMQVGSLLHINGADADAALRASRETRLGIPVLLADDGIHGHSFWAGASIFPTQLALACSWDTDLLEQVARVTALEMRATGLKWTFSPVLCLARDLRWGRINETFGEDPKLIGDFALAMIKGYQGKGLDDPDGILATAKHYAGYSETVGGRDASEAEISQRKLRSYFLPPFERAARGGAMAFMTGYQSIDGVPSTASRWLLTEVLKDEWGFEGIVVTDWYNLGHLVHDQKICADFAEASAVAIHAGNDLMMAAPEFFEGCQEAVRRGLLTEAEIDAVVRRVLTLKFRMGLFENPGPSNRKKIRELIGSRAHREVVLRAARESLVLLKNDEVNGAPLLPLDPKVPRKLALVGPNADDPLNQLGDWSLGSGQMVGDSGPKHPRKSIVTLKDGLKKALPPGWTLVSPQKADLIIAVVGDDLAHIGEFKSTATLELQNGQVELLNKLAKLKKPLIGVLLSSKPLVLPASLRKAPALFCAFNPGMEGGTAFAEALWGQLNPSGRLTISFPEHVGQQPVFYNAVRGQHGHRYADLTQEPAFSFGYGLSYSTVTRGAARLSAATVTPSGSVTVEVELTNTSARDTIEVLQLYVEDEVTSATWARRELKAWQRVTIKAGAKVAVRLALAASDLWLIDALGHKVVEPGRFRLLVGTSSRNQDLAELFVTVTKG
ncbi:MAG: glycoside hydrolase family 3 N-terminal domain-containing protein [Spirochaetales bacterium]